LLKEAAEVAEEGVVVHPEAAEVAAALHDLRRQDLHHQEEVPPQGVAPP